MQVIACKNRGEFGSRRRLATHKITKIKAVPKWHGLSKLKIEKALNELTVQRIKKVAIMKKLYPIPPCLKDRHFDHPVKQHLPFL